MVDIILHVCPQLIGTVSSIRISMIAYCDVNRHNDFVLLVCMFNILFLVTDTDVVDVVDVVEISLLQKAVMAAASLTISNPREVDIDYSQPFVDLGLKVIIKVCFILLVCGPLIKSHYKGLLYTATLWTSD